MKFGTLQQMVNQIAVSWPKIEIFKIQDGGGRQMAVAAILKIAFVAITHRRFSDFGEILCEEVEWHPEKGHMTKTANY